MPGGEQSQPHSKARTWNGRYVNIAHRRTPSELTPLIQQNLALQQQVEMLTAQNQHMMHQQQLQSLQSQGLLPPQGLQSATLLPPPPVFHTRNQSHSMTPSSPHHNRQRSMGHARRASLAVSEAKKYAQERASGNEASASTGNTNNTGNTNTSPSTLGSIPGSIPGLASSPSSSSPSIAAGGTHTNANNTSNTNNNSTTSTTTSGAIRVHAGSHTSTGTPPAPTTPVLPQLAPPPLLPSPQPPFGSPGPIETPQFRFPPSPDRSRSHSRSHSMNSFRRQTPSPQRFQFPPSSGDQHHHHQPLHQQQHSTQQHHNHQGGSNNTNINTNSNSNSNSNSHSHVLQPTQHAHAHQRSGSQSMLGSPQYFHQRTSSYSTYHARKNSQWEGHRPRPSNASDFSPAGARKSLFVPYLPQAAIPEMLADGFLVTGTLRVNHKNRSYAYVLTDLLDAEVLIDGSKDRNRALEGDLVAVELLNVDDVWEQKKEKEERKRRREETAAENGGSDANAGANQGSSVGSSAGGATSLRRKGSLMQRPPQKRSDDVEVEGQTLLLREELQSGEEKPLYCGHVVAVLERPAGQLFSGTLGLLRPSSQATKERQQHSRAGSVADGTETPKIVWFKPTDKCVPLMAIPTEQAPADLVENPQAYADRIFVSQIKRWPITSLHPFGTLVESLGSAGNAEVAQRAVLRDFNFGAHVFGDAALTEAQNVADQMCAAARDAQKYPVSAHPAVRLAADLAAAVYETSSGGSNTRVLAVHVLDVPSFVVRGGPLDRELRHKSAGVYMRGFESPLLPESVQSAVEFQVGRQSPALTVEIDLEAGGVHISRHSVVPVGVLGAEPSSDNSADKSDETSVLVASLTAAASTLRKRRGLGAISDPCVDLGSLLDVVVPAPASPLAQPSRSALVAAEITHAANAAVASELLRSKEIGLGAIVRRQSEPSLQRLEQFASLLRQQGVKIDTSSAQSLARSLAEQLPETKAVAVKALLAKLLSRQRYAVAAKTDPGQLGHYWFGFDAYTHFARPLLRYADHVVARQVHTVIAARAAAATGKGGSIAKSDNVGGPLSNLSSVGAPGGLAISTDSALPTTPPAVQEEFVTPPESSTPAAASSSAVQPSNAQPSNVQHSHAPDNTHLAPELSFRYDCAHGVQEQSAHLELAGTLESEYRLVRGIVIAVYESAFDVVVPELSVEKRVHGDQLPLARAEYDEAANRLKLFWMRGVDAATHGNERGGPQRPQPAIPSELRDKLVVTDGGIQEITALCEVPVLIRVSRQDRVLPSITVRVANPTMSAREGH